jgi:heptosyltransferase-3
VAKHAATNLSDRRCIMAAESILVFRIGSLGDTIVGLPCFHLIARAYPGARRILVTDVPASQKVAPVESVLGPSGLIHDVIYFPPPPRRLRDFLRLQTRIRQTGCTTLIYIADRKPAEIIRDRLFFRACGIRRIIGAALTADTRKLRVDPVTGDTEREAERLARCLKSLGPVDLNNPAEWELFLQPMEMQAAEAALEPLRGVDFIAVNISARIGRKDWGDENWTLLLQLMMPRSPNVGLVFFGTSDESARAAKLAANWLGPTLNLCGRLTPRESAAALRKALLFIGHDSGPLHLAAAVGVQCVGIYGDYNMPKWWHPIGDKHMIIHRMSDVRTIRPEEVYELVVRAADQMQWSKAAALGAVSA